MRDLATLLAASVLIPTATYSADPVPAAVDLQGFEGAAIFIHIGAGGIVFDAANKIEFKLTHSDDNVTYTPVDAGDVQAVAAVGAGGIVKALTAAHAAADVTKVGYVGGKRYLKLLPDFSGVHGTGTPIGAVVVKGYPRYVLGA